MRVKKIISSTILSTHYFLQTTSMALAEDGLTADGLYKHEGEQVATLGWIVTLAKSIVSVAIRLIGIAAFAMLLVGGLKVLSSGGDPKAMESGKKTITMAVAGLVLAVLSWFIINILEIITGVNLTTFTIFPTS